MISYQTFLSNCKTIEARIAAACLECGRDANSVKLLPVTKTHPWAAVHYAIDYGFKAVGENKIQETVDKQEQVAPRIAWEMIGHLQSNKAKHAVKHFWRIQSVDSLKLLQKIAAAATLEEKIMPILIQVNSGNDPAKFGVTCEDAPSLLEAALSMPSIQVDGLMAIAPLDHNPIVAQQAFDRLRDTRDQLAATFGVALSELSMGMTGDLEQAIRAGSTQIRVGTALFGRRT